MSRLPYLVFYVLGEETVDVWRVLHTSVVEVAEDELRREGRQPAPG